MWNPFAKKKKEIVDVSNKVERKAKTQKFNVGMTQAFMKLVDGTEADWGAEPGYAYWDRDGYLQVMKSDSHVIDCLWEQSQKGLYLMSHESNMMLNVNQVVSIRLETKDHQIEVEIE